SALDKQMNAVTRQTESMARRFETLSSQAEALGRKQDVFEGLRAQLSHASDLAKQTGRQVEALQENQRTLNNLRRDLKELTASYTTVTQLGDRLQTEREALEAFGERMSAMSSRAVELDAKMKTVVDQLGLIEQGSAKAAELGRNVQSLDQHLEAVETRLPVLKDVETRLDRLNAVSADVDTRLQEQNARRGEVDAIKAQCDELGERVVEAQHRLETVRFAQARLAPMTTAMDRLEHRIGAAATQIESLSRDEAAMVAQEQRFLELVDASRGVAAQVAERAHDMKRMSDAVSRATHEKDALMTAL